MFYVVKVAAVKIEKLKVFIIKCFDISKTYSVLFHLFGSVKKPSVRFGSVQFNSYFYFFIYSFSMVFSHQFSIN